MTFVPSQDAVNAFCAAASRGDIDALKRFADMYPDHINKTGGDGRDALMSAAWGQKPEAVAFLLARHADVTARDPRGWTALMLAAWQGRADIVSDLLEKKAPVDAQSKESLTALMLAANMGRTVAVGRLMQAGADPDLRDDTGRTAEEMAFERGFHNSVATIAACRKQALWQQKKSDDVTDARLSLLRKKRPSSPAIRRKA